MPSITQGKTISSSAQIEPGVILNSDINAAAAIEATKIQELSVGVNGGVIPSTGIVNAHIAAAAAIAYSKLAALTQGGVLIGSTSNVPTVLAPGSNGQFLKSQGAGADPVWAAANASFFVQATSQTNSKSGQHAGATVLTLAPTGTTNSFGQCFMPDATISSIQMLMKANSSAAGNIILDLFANDYTDGAATVEDTQAAQSFTDLASNTNWQLLTVPTAVYDGITKGRVWSFRANRLGDNGGDTYGDDVFFMGWLINL